MKRASWRIDPPQILQEVQYDKLSYEVDPLLCGCGGAMVVISFITDPKTIDHILSHLRKNGSTLFDPSHTPEARAPPF